MAKFRRKTSVVDAVEFTRETWNKAQHSSVNDEASEEEVFERHALRMISHENGVGFTVEGNSGPVKVLPGMWIIVKENGMANPVDKENFASLYESCDEEGEDKAPEEEAFTPVPLPVNSNSNLSGIVVPDTIPASSMSNENTGPDNSGPAA